MFSWVTIVLGMSTEGICTSKKKNLLNETIYSEHNLSNTTAKLYTLVDFQN